MALPASDNFNRADGGLGANWATQTGAGAIQIASNEVYSAGVTSPSADRWVADTFDADQYAQATLTSLGSGDLNDRCGVAVRMSTSGARSLYAAVIASTGFCYLIMYNAGSFSVLLNGTSLSAWLVGDVLRLEAQGTALRVYRNGTLFMSVTNSTHTSGAAGLAGINGGAADSPRLDDWSAGNLAPTAPSGLTVTGTTNTTVSLSWTDNSTDETGFKIERSSGGGAFSQIHTTAANATTYTDTGRSPNTSHTYRVRAAGDVDSAYSNEATGLTTNTLAAPSSLSATLISDTQVNLGWSDSNTNETGFKIERQIGSGSFVEVGTAGANATTYSDTTAVAGQSYTYRVRATNVSGDSSASNTATVTTPIPPSSLTATAVSDTQINLTWTDNTSTETGFAVQYSTDGTNYDNLSASAANTTSRNVTGLTISTSYWFRVAAIFATGTTSWSNVAAATTFSLPAAPSHLTAMAVSDVQVDLIWTDGSNNETGFKIERAVGIGAFSEIATVGPNVISYSSTGLTAQTAYSYRVRATNTVGNSSYSNTASATTLQTPISLTVEIAFASDPFAASPTWVDVTSRVRVDEPIIIRRGRQNELGRIEPGRLSLTMDNRDRALDPLNTSSPYYPNVKPRRRIRVSATWDGETHRLYTGYCRFSNNWGVADNTCRADAVDALDMFARIPMVERALLTWQPSPDTTQLLTETTGYNVASLAGFAGQLRVTLASRPTSTQTVDVTGTRPDGSSVNDVYVFSTLDETWEDGIIGTGVFQTITVIESNSGGIPDIQRAITFTVVPAFGGLSGYATDDNIAGLLDYANYPAGLRDIEAGYVTITVWSPTQSEGVAQSQVVSGLETVGAAIQRVVETEGGQFYIRGDGTATFESQRRRQYSYIPGATVLGSGAGEISYRDPSFDDGDAMVYNQVRLSRAAAGTAPAIADATSSEIAEYGIRPYSRTGLLAASTSFLRLMAGRLLYHRKAAVPRVTGLTIDADTSNFSTVLGWDISTPVTVRLRPPGAPTSYDKPSWVESLEWRITRSAWTLRLGLSPAELGNDLYRTISGAGMAFPTSPYLDQVFYRSDLDLLCYYDGTQWLTVNEYTVALGPTTALPISAAPQGLCIAPMRSDYSAYVTRVSVLSYVLTTNNGSNYWSLILRRDSTALHSPTTAAQAANTWTRSEASVNAAHTGTYFELISSSKTGSPGNLYGAATVNYRLIIT